MTNDFVLKEFGGNLNPIFKKEQGIGTVKEVVTKIEYDLIPIQDIAKNTQQPRQNFPDEEIKELADSIRKQGVIQPIIVRPVEDNKYELVAGERRLRASKVAELDKIPALIREYNDKEVFFIAMIENLQREDLNPIEEAMAYKKLADYYNLSHEQIGAEVGKSRVAITNMLRLLSLEPEVRSMLEKNIIGMGHARALISLSKEEQLKLANEIITRNLTVRDVEKLVSKLGNPKLPKPEIEDEVHAKTQIFLARMTNELSARVKIQVNNQWKGRATIYFESKDELEQLVDKIAKE